MNYDVLVIGGGPGGCRAAEYAARNSLKAVLFEREELGGVCLNHGCIPTKTLLYAARLHDRMKYDAPMFGVNADNLRLDPVVLWERKERTVKRLRAALAHRLREAGVEVIKVEAEIFRGTQGNFSVRANGRDYAGKNLILATGGRPKIPEIPGLPKALLSGFAVTPREILTTPEIPANLLILGGGTIGIEFATFYRSAGAEVMVVEQSANIGGKLDERLSGFVQLKLQKRGVRFFLNSQITGINEKQLTLDDRIVLEADRLLLACGWEASPIILEADKFRNRPDGLFLIGDAAGRHFLAPVAEQEAEAAVNHILGKSDAVDYSWIPHVIFSDPEIASAGKRLAEAQKIDPSAYEKHFPLNLSARYGIEHPSENGCGICVYSGKGELIGVHLAGAGSIELLNSYHITKAIHPSIVEWIDMTDRVK